MCQLVLLGTCRVLSGSNTWSWHGEGKWNDSPHEACKKEVKLIIYSSVKVHNDWTCTLLLCYNNLLNIRWSCHVLFFYIFSDVSLCFCFSKYFLFFFDFYDFLKNFVSREVFSPLFAKQWVTGKYIKVGKILPGN